jgi:demethylmenaquinone methyltransferase/2-methoxy-6-polyprenyl-1,4-benzoquinol methylase
MVFFVILETSVPDKTLTNRDIIFTVKNILPIINFFKDDVAYGYLSESAAAFPYGEALNNILRKIGFIDVIALPQHLG